MESLIMKLFRLVVKQRRGEPIIISKDEEFTNISLEKIPKLRPAFSKDGSVTAANASTINDGAAALILMSEEKAINIKSYSSCKNFKLCR